MNTKPSAKEAPAKSNAIATCEVLVEDHEHEGKTCAKGAQITIPTTVAEQLVKCDPPRVKILAHA